MKRNVVPMEPARSLTFMQTPNEWRTWPWLPVKRRVNGELEVGLMCQSAGTVRADVYLCNLFDNHDIRRAAPKKGYKSLNDLIADGWLVD